MGTIPIRPLVATTLATGILLALPVTAEEVLVRNDSIVAFDEAVILGDFIAGERAGVRLTSPCDGTIVAVQVLWLEGTPGHPQSLEEGIYIFADGSFPTPGAELAKLEGPVLTPGFMNEFRYLDEAQTIPLDVPIGADQNFFVALEFYNPTDVGNGGPSVVRDVTGCQAGRNVLYGDPGLGWGWWDFCFLISGDIAIRAVIDCPAATGACCYASGLCADEIEEVDCIAEFGAQWHEGQSCEQISCDPRGACCRLGDCLTLVEPSVCESIDGVYAGDGTNCADQVCISGACCIAATGECVQNFEFQCVVMGGNFQGPGSTCEPDNPCPQPLGACCFDTVCLGDQLEAQCMGSGGEWAGPGTNCDDLDGNDVADVCESGAPLCAGDLNCDGIVDFDDIDPFVAALGCQGGEPHCWDPNCPWLNGDCNADDTVDFDDIDPFVARIGASCP